MTETVIFYECKNDKGIARIMSDIVGGAKLRHGGGKTNTLKKAFKENCDKHVITIIDHDPGTPWPKDFQQILTSMSKIDNDTYVYSSTQNCNKILVLILSPRLEDWLANKCKVLNINVDPKKLHIDEKKFNNVLSECEKVVRDILEKALSRNST
ncbi:MAG: hypothetical protein QXE01_08755 [Sulfolobales archaeon]